jgi:hypothetical protein
MCLMTFNPLSIYTFWIKRLRACCINVKCIANRIWKFLNFSLKRVGFSRSLGALQPGVPVRELRKFFLKLVSLGNSIELSVLLSKFESNKDILLTKTVENLIR